MQTVSTVSAPSRTINTASKDLLARILASENITVQHDPKASTAAFDTKNRVLILPAWTGMTNEVYDMLVGHEVGHALFTPHSDADDKVQGPWCGAAEEIAGTAHAKIAQVYMNIVEDARIEKLMKEKFPGMRRDFYKAYEQFVANDFFGIKGRDINKLPLIDRINLQYKMGTCMDTGIQFSPVEQSFIKRIDTCRTFDDVKSIVSDIWEYESRLKEEAEKQKQEATAKGKQGDADAGEDGETTQIPVSGGDDQDDSDASDSTDANAGQSDDSADSDKQGSGKRAGGDDKQDKQTPQTTGASTGEGANKMQHDSAAPASTTQEKFDEAVKKMTDKRGTQYQYFNLPSCNTDNIIISYTEIEKILSNHRATLINTAVDMNDKLFRDAKKKYEKFAADSAPVVALMAKQFDLRKAADAAKRTSVAKTGVLDTVRMVNYKITDDIFRRNTVVREGKNHGLVMFIDWSGSMGPTLLDTVKQLMQIALFCRRCNIPFEVYAFTSCVIKEDLAKLDHYEPTVYSKQWNTKDKDKDAKFHMFSLLNFLSSKMRPNQFKQAMENLFAIATAQNDGTYYYTLPGCLGLSSTPLDESIVAAMQIVPKFREDNRLQIVHSVFLTDGDTSGSFAYGGGMYCRKFLTDPVTRKTYEIGTSTNTLLQVFRDRTGCNAIGFFLYGRQTVNHLTHLFVEYGKDKNGMRVAKSNTKTDYANKQIESFKDNGFAVVHPTASGYTEQYIIRADMRVENDDAMTKLGTDATMTRIKNAFMATAAKRMKSRVMLNRFIDLIAK
jgi:hypothetical protein